MGTLVDGGDSETHEVAFASLKVTDSEVLDLIEEEELTSFSFEGLKRRMGAHSETLSRSLDRLEESNLLQKTEGGYRLTDEGRNHVSVRPLSSQGQRIMLVRTLMPPTITLKEVFSRLKGKWFGQLRWLGYSDAPEELILKWVTSDGNVQLDARLSQAELSIEGRLLKGDAGMASAVSASHQLMAHISRAYSKPASMKRLMFTLQDSYLMPN